MTATQRAAFPPPNLSQRQQEVFDALKLKPKTDHETAAATHMPVHLVCARRNELMKAGLVFNSGTTRASWAGYQNIVWTTTPPAIPQPLSTGQFILL